MSNNLKQSADQVISVLGQDPGYRQLREWLKKYGVDNTITVLLTTVKQRASPLPLREASLDLATNITTVPLRLRVSNQTRQAVYQAALSLLASKPASLRRAALTSLGYFVDGHRKELTRVALERIQVDSDDDVRADAAWVLSNIGRYAIKPVLRAIHDKGFQRTGSSWYLIFALEHIFIHCEMDIAQRERVIREIMTAAGETDDNTFFFRLCDIIHYQLPDDRAHEYLVELAEHPRRKMAKQAEYWLWLEGVINLRSAQQAQPG